MENRRLRLTSHRPSGATDFFDKLRKRINTSCPLNPRASEDIRLSGDILWSMRSGLSSHSSNCFDRLSHSPTQTTSGDNIHHHFCFGNRGNDEARVVMWTPCLSYSIRQWNLLFGERIAWKRLIDEPVIDRVMHQLRTRCHVHFVKDP